MIHHELSLNVADGFVDCRVDCFGFIHPALIVEREEVQEVCILEDGIRLIHVPAIDRSAILQAFQNAVLNVLREVERFTGIFNQAVQNKLNKRDVIHFNREHAGGQRDVQNGGDVRQRIDKAFFDDHVVAGFLI